MLRTQIEYIDAIKRDVHWLGFDWAQGLRLSSDRFEQLYAWACHLVRNGKANVEDQSVHDIGEGRGHRRAWAITARFPTATWRKTPSCSRECAQASSETASGCSA